MESTPDHTASKGAAQLQVAQVSFPGTEPEGLRDGQRASEEGGSFSDLRVSRAARDPRDNKTTLEAQPPDAQGRRSGQPSALPLELAELAIGAWRPPPQPVTGPFLRPLSD